MIQVLRVLSDKYKINAILLEINKLLSYSDERQAGKAKNWYGLA
jgi:hypothetical protein